MKSNAMFLVMSVLLGVSQAAPGLFYGAIPVPSSDTKVYRDFLGNQATSYAYQDGHSSAVSLSRSDVSKHLVAAPVEVAVPAAPIVYSQPEPLYHHAPAYAAPIVQAVPYTASSYQYHHRYPSYTSYAYPAYASYY